MLRELIQQESVQKVLKILLDSKLFGILEYPSYKTLAYSDKLSPDNNVLNLNLNETNHYVAKFSHLLRDDMYNYRINGISSSWLIIMKTSKLSNLRLFRIDDVPIFHNKQLIGMCLSYTDVSLDNILLLNMLIDKPSQQITPINQPYDSLSNFEREVLYLAALGKSNKQISGILDNLGIRNANSSTINTLISQRIYNKMNSNTLDSAILKGIETKQIDAIPESLLLSMLKDYYLINTRNHFIEL